MKTKFRGWDTIKLRITSGEEVSAKTPVIISASRSTDIPAHYSEWFMNRWREGYVKWFNPFNRKPSYFSFGKTRVIVFWTKDPKPLMEHLDKLDESGVNYYFQYTLNDYEGDGLEPKLCSLDERVNTFKELSGRAGKERVIWRFDPLVLGGDLGIEELLERIGGVGDRISGFTDKLVFSFADIDMYRKVRANLNRNEVPYREFTREEMQTLAKGILDLKQKWDLRSVATCAEEIDLPGIEHNRCIDDELMLRIFSHDKKLMDFLGAGKTLFNDLRPNLKDKGQRKECGCIVSKDIGMYDTCPFMCVYCYANTSSKAVQKNMQLHRDESESIVDL